jgi:putative DNA primase/helicase
MSEIEKDLLEEIARQLKEDKASDIQTQNSGFHYQITDKHGKITHKAAYEDLRIYFERKHHYKNLGDTGICYIWTGTHYKSLGDSYIEQFAQYKFDPKPTTFKTREFKNLVHRTNLRDVNWFDESIVGKINFKNGVYDIKSDSFSKHTSDLGFRYVLDYDFDSNAEANAFKKMLDGVTVHDSALQQILLEFMAYSLCGDPCWARKALILEGSGSNGKSTFMNVMRDMAGRENCTSVSLADLKSEYSRQMLDGKLFNMAEETPTKAMADSSIFKNLVTGGDIQVRAIFKSPYVMKNKAKMIFACNELPHSFDTTPAFFNRFILVPFRAVFDIKSPDFDPQIEYKLKAELSGIFNMVMKSYACLHSRKGFPEAEVSKKALDEYRRDLNPLIDWVQHNLDWHELGNGCDHKTLPISKIYEAYAQDMKILGLYPMTITTFGKKLKEVQPDYPDRRALSRSSIGRVIKIVKAVSFRTDKSAKIDGEIESEFHH